MIVLWSCLGGSFFILFRVYRGLFLPFCSIINPHIACYARLMMKQNHQKHPSDILRNKFKTASDYPEVRSQNPTPPQTTRKVQKPSPGGAAAPCVGLFSFQLISPVHVRTKKCRVHDLGNPARVPGFRLKTSDLRRPTFYSFRTTCIICSPKPIV